MSCKITVVRRNADGAETRIHPKDTTMDNEKTIDEQRDPEKRKERPRRIRQLPCAMTDTELLEVSDQIDELISVAEDLKASKKSSASSYKSQIDATVERLQRLSKLRRRRITEREVEVEIVTDLARAEETITRLDTGEVVSRRTLSSREVEEQRQVKFPLPEGQPGSAKRELPSVTDPPADDAAGEAKRAMETLSRKRRD